MTLSLSHSSPIPLQHTSANIVPPGAAVASGPAHDESRMILCVGENGKGAVKELHVRHGIEGAALLQPRAAALPASKFARISRFFAGKHTSKREQAGPVPTSPVVAKGQCSATATTPA